jgi:beta-RFAP synthase
MPGLAVEVVAPSRLHFGMFSFGQPGVRQFGGVGAMVCQPGLRLRLEPAEHFEATGPLSDRVTPLVERISRLLKMPGPLACRIEVMAAPPEHVGLGTGTQLALSIAAALHAFGGDAFHHGNTLSPVELATMTGRAERSAIGTYGFAHGGLLMEAGKLEGETLSPLVDRVELPEAWRFALIWPHGERGLSGEAERAAFRDLPSVPTAMTERLIGEAYDELLPAAKGGDIARLSESVYRFNYEAGLCFAARQAGAYATERVGDLVQTIRGLGVRGVGQSSWGPAVFALLESDTAANDFCDRMQKHLDGSHTLIVARPDNAGARITRLGS